MNRNVVYRKYCDLEHEDEDGIRFFKGCINGLIIVTPIWGIVITLICYIP